MGPGYGRLCCRVCQASAFSVVSHVSQRMADLLFVEQVRVNGQYAGLVYYHRLGAQVARNCDFPILLCWAYSEDYIHIHAVIAAEPS